ncbi:hypothetical protein AB0125_28210, partial [Klebsiella pneumoniae]
VMFGDLHQLPPVVQDGEEAGYLTDTFGGPFFFSADGLREGAGTHRVELTEVFLQSDTGLISVLNEIRDGSPSEAALARLNGRVNPLRTLGEGDP